MRKSRYLRHPRTTQELRALKGAREQGVRTRTARAQLPTVYDDIPVSQERCDRDKNKRRL